MRSRRWASLAVISRIRSPPVVASSSAFRKSSAARVKLPISIRASPASRSRRGRCGSPGGRRASARWSEVRGGRHVAARQRATTGRREVLRPSPPVSRVRSSLPPSSVKIRNACSRWYPRISSNSRSAIGRDLLEPIDEGRVQLGTRALEHPLVRDIADEDVLEAVDGKAHEHVARRTHELLRLERVQALADEGSDRLRREGFDASADRTIGPSPRRVRSPSGPWGPGGPDARRASDVIVLGTSSSSSGLTATQRPSTCRTASSSTSIESMCSRNRGLPSAAAVNHRADGRVDRPGAQQARQDQVALVLRER